MDNSTQNHIFELYPRIIMKDLIKCFLIDDDEDDYEIFRMALSEVDESIQVQYAFNGMEALRKLREDQSLLPNYFFVDLNMPRMNGKQCLEAIRKSDQLKDVPVYIYFIFADSKTVAELNYLFAADFIVKPSNIKSLVHILSELLGFPNNNNNHV